MKTKLIKTLSLLLLACLLFFIQAFKIPVLDTNAERYFSDAIKKAALAYATTRVINASISIIKESEVQLEPGGVGVSMAVGQIVDPLDDMTERLSNILVTAIASLGVQRLIYEICSSIAPSLLIILLVIFAILIWIDRWNINGLQRILLGFTTIIIVARFFLPVSSLVNDFLYKGYFLDDINEARMNLAFASKELDKIKGIELPEIDGVAGTIKNSGLFLKSKTIEFKDALIAITDDTGQIITNMLTLTWLYVGIFFIQVIALPLLMFWLLVKIINTFFSMSIPTIFSHRKS